MPTVAEIQPKAPGHATPPPPPSSPPAAATTAAREFRDVLHDMEDEAADLADGLRHLEQFSVDCIGVEVGDGNRRGAATHRPVQMTPVDAAWGGRVAPPGRRSRGDKGCTQATTYFLDLHLHLHLHPQQPTANRHRRRSCSATARPSTRATARCWGSWSSTSRSTGTSPRRYSGRPPTLWS